MNQPFDLITESAALALAEAADDCATADAPELPTMWPDLAADDAADLPAFLFA